MLQQKSVYETITPTHFLEKNAINCVIKEDSVINRKIAVNNKDEPQDVVSADF